MADVAHQASDTAFECVEIYVPKKLEHLSELYNYLRRKLADRKEGRPQAVPIDGFSLYEVDGAFYGSELYQERTVVIRILLSQAVGDGNIHEKVRTLGHEVAATVALSEEELWIAHYPQQVVIMRPGGDPERIS